MARKYGWQKPRPRIRYMNREYENRIGEVRVDEDFTIKELAEIAGVAPGTIQQLQSGMGSAVYNNRYGGGIKPWVEKICVALKATPGYLFPREICDIQRGKLLNSQKNDILMSTHSKMYCNGIHELREMMSLVLDVLDTLSDREQTAIVMHFWEGCTLQEIGDVWGVTREMARLVLSRALRTLRHSTRSWVLRGYV